MINTLSFTEATVGLMIRIWCPQRIHQDNCSCTCSEGWWQCRMNGKNSCKTINQSVNQSIHLEKGLGDTPGKGFEADQNTAQQRFLNQKYVSSWLAHLGYEHIAASKHIVVLRKMNCWYIVHPHTNAYTPRPHPMRSQKHCTDWAAHSWKASESYA